MRFLKTLFAFLMMTATTTYASANRQQEYKPAHSLTPEQSALIDKAIAREKLLIQAIRLRTPLVETYIQNTRPDDKLNTVPVSDEYMLSRVDFAKSFVDKQFADRSAKSKSESRFFKQSFEAYGRNWQSARTRKVYL